MMTRSTSRLLFFLGLTLLLLGLALFVYAPPSPEKAGTTSTSPEGIIPCEQNAAWQDCLGRQYAAATAAKEILFANDSAGSFESLANVRHIRFNYTIQNLEDRPAERFSLWQMLPPLGLPHQQLLKVALSHPAKVAVDSRGQRILQVELRDLAPFETQMLSILTTVGSGAAGPVLPVDLKNYTGAEPLIESNDSLIKQTADRLLESDALATTKMIYQHIVRGIKPLGFAGPAHGARWALENRKGDCTEMALLFTALCRAAGIPARTLTGYLADHDMVIKAADLHNWAQFFHEGRWHTVDPFYKKITPDDSQYLALEIFQANQENPIGPYHVYRYDAQGVRFKVSY